MANEASQKGQNPPARRHTKKMLTLVVTATRNKVWNLHDGKKNSKSAFSPATANHSL